MSFNLFSVLSWLLSKSVVFLYFDTLRFYFQQRIIWRHVKIEIFDHSPEIVDSFNQSHATQYTWILFP